MMKKHVIFALQMVPTLLLYISNALGIPTIRRSIPPYPSYIESPLTRRSESNPTQPTNKASLAFLLHDFPATTGIVPDTLLSTNHHLQNNPTVADNPTIPNTIPPTNHHLPNNPRVADNPQHQSTQSSSSKQTDSHDPVPAVSTTDVDDCPDFKPDELPGDLMYLKEEKDDTITNKAKEKEKHDKKRPLTKQEEEELVVALQLRLLAFEKALKTSSSMTTRLLAARRGRIEVLVKEQSLFVQCCAEKIILAMEGAMPPEPPARGVNRNLANPLKTLAPKPS
ncbi:hypothetical protein H0H93_008925 [Arthromyces matolae]|nr:hypothetical protein H0H93_008925 [Arthromyces matolae]